MREFLRTESGSAGVLVGAVVAALVWANVDAASYESVWQTRLSIRLGDNGIAWDLRTWLNSGFMTLFFLVVGLEARREFDLGELRDRRRFVLPLAAGLAAMLVPVLIYLAVNHGGSGAHGWGVAMSTDTALALGLLAVLGRDVPDRVRAFLLTVFVVDDLAALAVIAVVYSHRIEMTPFALALLCFAALIAAMVAGLNQRWVYAGLGFLMWAALVRSGIDPVVAGLAIGLSATAYSPSRVDLEEATGLVRQFREQPTAELARSATVGLTATLSPNARLQNFYHPWTSYVIVPLFALANAGIVIDGGFLGRAYAAPVTLGIILGYVVGKPIGLVGTAWLVARLTGGRIRPPVGWAAVAGSGTLGGIGFTVSLLIATRAFHGEQLAEAKLGALTAVVISSVLTWTVYRVTALLSPARRARALLGTSQQMLDLIPAVDPARDHVRGPAEASVTIVEYGDFECPYCGQAEPVVRNLLTDNDIRYVWRHLPLTDVHASAQLAAEAAEAAAAQGSFWPMHDLLLQHQEDLRPKDLVRYAAQLGLDADLFHDDVMRHVHAGRIAQDVESADLSGVSGTPTFFINDQRHYGAYDVQTLKAAVKTARLRQVVREAR
ncbi:MAG: Na+/H+ antiporter NhaA [Actinomycetota bacterium]|nr:Na+/H+ antiporter NhaA [Actinomycetota bacterium]